MSDRSLSRACKEQLRRRRRPSGSGKSSLVFAGLLPALRKQGRTDMWDVVTLRPGKSPCPRSPKRSARRRKTPVPLAIDT